MRLHCTLTKYTCLSSTLYISFLVMGGRRYHVIWLKLFMIHLEVHQLLEKQLQPSTNLHNWVMRGHFQHLHFNSFPMTWKTPQGKVFWPLKLNSEISGVLKDSQVPISRMWMSSSHSSKSGVAINKDFHKSFNMGSWVFISSFKKLMWIFRHSSEHKILWDENG
jgi:hypothetical protein